MYYPPKNTPITLTISVLDTAVTRLPEDLTGRSLDDPDVVERFKGLLDYIASQTPNLHILSVSIGNEIDGVLGTDDDAWAAYATFFGEAADHARTLWPGIPAGSKMPFGSLTGASAPYAQAFNELADAVFVTYYPLEQDFTVRSPDAPTADLKQLVDAYPGRPIQMLEVGYPSGEDNASSEAMQAAFIHHFFCAWDQHAEAIQLVSFTFLTDMTRQTAESLGGYYSLDDRAFGSYLATLGLRDQDGREKPALEQMRQEAAARGW
jgi:hypothetical protein